MIIQKLRLQRGWSQSQLAQFSGLSTRTIQRIERGQPASLESQKSLAAVFEINITQLQQESDMSATMTTSESTTLPEDEVRALKKVRDLKGFYIHAFKFSVVIAILFVINYLTSPDYIWAWWVVLGWGLSLAGHAFKVFRGIPFLGADWEKAQVEKRLGRKL